jgi:hypothetical protein
VPVHTDFDVLSESLPDGVRYSVRNIVGFVCSAKIVNDAPGRETGVQMYAVTGMWKNTFAAADAAVTNQSLDCP